MCRWDGFDYTDPTHEHPDPASKKRKAESAEPPKTNPGRGKGRGKGKGGRGIDKPEKVTVKPENAGQTVPVDPKFTPKPKPGVSSRGRNATISDRYSSSYTSVGLLPVLWHLLHHDLS